LRHLTAPAFWKRFERLPEHVQNLARKNYGLLKHDPRHPSLHYKQIGRFRSVRVGEHYRALGVEGREAIVWFWIGTHAEYDRLIR
jgi:hypothetical protein